ncbi:MAG: hypothetical protein HS117_06335 [Verrucomicrobiaceae bacterium]|nr:hypothetical protein [Verrucomicrobiaceae bacterium]
MTPKQEAEQKTKAKNKVHPGSERAWKELGRLEPAWGGVENVSENVRIRA